MKYLAVIQARLTSKRLFRKVLRPLGGIALLLHIVERLKNTSLPFIFVIPDSSENDELAIFLKNHSLPFLRGSEENVYSRYVKAAKKLDQEDYIIRITADNPFLDYKALFLLQQILEFRKPHYASCSGLPIGMGFEIIQKKILLSQEKMGMQPYHYEHVTLWVRENPHNFDFYSLELFKEVPKIRMTIDEEIDFVQAEAVYNYFSKNQNRYFTSQDVYRLYQNNSSLLLKNSHVEQRSR